MFRFSADQYELLDFGAGRRLERFGPHVLDRPCPTAAEVPRRRPADWQKADARYQRTADNQGQWTGAENVQQPWLVHCGPLVLELKLTPFGHLGLFPEQVENWNWIARLARAAGRPLNVLNLFAYTGGSTLAAAAAGCAVAHVDAAANVVAWARRNAELSKLSHAPVRWITEDAVKFVRRELKRGRQYDAVILDPPSYGHGPHGEVWKLDEHLDELWRMCCQLTARRREFQLLSWHSHDFNLADWLRKLTMDEPTRQHVDGQFRSSAMTLVSVAGERLQCGASLRCTAHETGE
jgi:23S rRNA (cytosine1962-C5)-methyltransferase